MKLFEWFHLNRRARERLQTAERRLSDAKAVLPAGVFRQALLVDMCQALQELLYRVATDVSTTDSPRSRMLRVEAIQKLLARARIDGIQEEAARAKEPEPSRSPPLGMRNIRRVDDHTFFGEKFDPEEEASSAARSSDAEAEMKAIREELYAQWYFSHRKHCQDKYPHEGRCVWPMPDILASQERGRDAARPR